MSSSSLWPPKRTGGNGGAPWLNRTKRTDRSDVSASVTRAKYNAAKIRLRPWKATPGKAACDVQACRQKQLPHQLDSSARLAVAVAADPHTPQLLYPMGTTQDFLPTLEN
eukprot:CAMPEP_0183420114 /NCGR_PEP_ID=MMETSP0370-20130417/26244_1 /TAXON_ID=268820 /ORGANISM="Peridinium aciculiferum, Strain PAER-2" /LENGTH=109 /DNA_ID=CAMNT_0025603977 /DNA_START=276 /DNA_END=606 /DNA_ORIENTATION=+